MNDKVKPHLTDSVAETLFIPLSMRARETERPDAIVRDPLAVALTRRIDYDFSHFKHDDMSLTGVAVRTCYLDERTDDFISRHEHPVAVFLGCGLDTRRQRLKQADRAVCYELDLPEVIDFRERVLPSNERDRYIASSMFETGWMDELRTRHASQPFVFVCEGVAMYFDIGMVKDFICRLAARFPDSELYLERSSRMMVNKAKMHSSVKHTQAQFKSGMDDPHEPETWASNIRLIDEFYYSEHAKRRWGLAGAFMRLVPTLRRSFGIWAYRIEATR